MKENEGVGDSGRRAGCHTYTPRVHTAHGHAHHTPFKALISQDTEKASKQERPTSVGVQPRADPEGQEEEVEEEEEGELERGGYTTEISQARHMSE